MANPWDADEIVDASPITMQSPTQPEAQGNPWDADPVVEDDGQGFNDQPLNIDIVGGNRAPDGWEYGTGRDLAFGARSVIQGLGNTIGAIGGDAFNSYIVNPIARAVGAEQARPYSVEAKALADQLGLPQAQTAGDRVLGDVGEALTGLGAGLGTAGLARTVANPVVAGVAEQSLQNAGTQTAATIAGSTASGVTRESGGGTGAQIAAGLIGGVAPSVARVGVPAAAGAVLSSTVPEARRDLARQAQARGIELTPAQLSDSRFVKFAQSALRSVPFTGAARRNERQVAQFNRAVANAIGETANNVDSQVYAAAKQRQSDLFDQLTSRNALSVDTRFLNSINNISNNASVSPQAKQAVDAAIERLYDQAATGANGVVIPGRAYQALDSDLGQVARAGGAEGYYIGQLRDAVRSAMDRSISPQDAQAWRQLRREYGNRKTIAPLVAKSGDEGISPQQLLNAATNSGSAKEAMAAGNRGELGTLGNIGRLMREPPSSGTAERLFVGSLFGAGGIANPALSALSLTAANLAARGLDSRSIARLMIQQNPGLSMADAERIAAQAIIPATAATSGTEETQR